MKKNPDPNRQLNRQEAGRNRAIGDWLKAKAEKTVDGKLYGTRPALAKEASEALGFTVSPSTITTQAGACTLEFAAKKKAPTKRSSAAAAGELAVWQIVGALAVVVQNMNARISALAPGYTISREDAELLQTYREASVAARVEMQGTQKSLPFPATE